MRKIYVLIYLFSTYLLCIGQNNGFNKDDLYNLKLTVYSDQCKITDGLICPYEASKIFENYIDTLSSKSILLRSNKVNISQIYSNMPLDIRIIEDEEIVPEIYKYNGLNSILFKGIAYPYTLNAYRLSEKERAVKIIKDVASPIFFSIGEYANLNNIPYIGLLISYTSRDFTSRYSYNSVETIVVICSSSIIQKYYNNQMSEDVFIKKCNYYLNSKRMPSSLIKIDVTL